jgi:hypothetical protein
VVKPICLTEQLPDLEIGELVNSQNAGAQCAASSPSFRDAEEQRCLFGNLQFLQQHFRVTSAVIVFLPAGR